MDVFVIPVGPDQYELYCEQPVAADEPIDSQETGFSARLRRRFRNLIRAAEERERMSESDAPRPKCTRGDWDDR